jgi:hypothetical protein
MKMIIGRKYIAGAIKQWCTPHQDYILDHAHQLISSEPRQKHSSKNILF